MILIINAILMFCVGFVTDFIWALYIQSLAENKNLKAANTSVLIGMCGIVWVEGLLSNQNLMVFWLCGLWFGTYYSHQIESFFKKIMLIFKSNNKN